MPGSPDVAQQLLLGATGHDGDHALHTLVMQTYLATVGNDFAGFL